MHASARQALVSAGANLGNRAETLRAAVERLSSVDGVTHVTCSAIYETEPVGVADQPKFLNLAIGLETTLSPEQLLTELQTIEQAFGRVRTVRWGPRTLDLDLLAYEGEERATPALTLPHPRMFERAFVVVPLREILSRAPFRERWRALRERIDATDVDASGVQRH